MLDEVGWHAFKFQLPGNNSGIGSCFLCGYQWQLVGHGGKQNARLIQSL